MSVASAGILESYKKTEVETATPAKLLLMLYDAAIRRLGSAVEAIRSGQYEHSHNDLLRVQDILTELMASLDWDAPGAPVAELFSLYDYMYRNLIQANIKRQIEPIEEAASIIVDLRDAWEKAIRIAGVNGVPEDMARTQPARRVDLAG